jgi:hypothetical protein
MRGLDQEHWPQYQGARQDSAGPQCGSSTPSRNRLVLPLCIYKGAWIWLPLTEQKMSISIMPTFQIACPSIMYAEESIPRAPYTEIETKRQSRGPPLCVN